MPGFDASTTLAQARRRAADARRSRRSATSSRSTSRCSSAGHDIVSIHLSRRHLAGPYGSAVQARDAARRARARAAAIEVLDSRTGAAGHGLWRSPRRRGARRRRRCTRSPSAARERARDAEDLVRRRHARVPAPRRARRRRAGVARRRAEDQADPHARRRDHAGRARAHVRQGVRADGRVHASTREPTAPTAGSSSTSRRPSRPSGWSSAAARSTAASRCSSREVGPVIGTHVGPGSSASAACRRRCWAPSSDVRR